MMSKVVRATQQLEGISYSYALSKPKPDKTNNLSNEKPFFLHTLYIMRTLTKAITRVDADQCFYFRYIYTETHLRNAVFSRGNTYILKINN